LSAYNKVVAQTNQPTSCALAQCQSDALRHF